VSRAVTRATTAVLAWLGTALLTAGPAYADNPLGNSEGADPGKGLGTIEAIALYVVLPLSIVLTIFLIVWLPGAVKANRYRPNKAWNARPVWFAGPPDPIAAVQSADPGDVVRGGASGRW